MKIAVIFDADATGGGGYFQSLKTSILLSNIESSSLNFVFIRTDKNDGSNDDFIKHKIKPILFKKKRLSRLYYRLSESKFLNYFFKKSKNPFNKFLIKEKIDLAFFLGPSDFINYCEDINFITNIYDINFKFENSFPEYKNRNYNMFEKSVNSAYRILVDTKRTKEELMKYFNCYEKKINIYPFDPYLPTVYNEIKDKFKPEDNLKAIGLKENEKFIFYPAQFWAHKNHKYIIDAIEILKAQKKINFKTIFCGSNKKNFSYIKNEIKKKKLENDIIMFPFLSNEQIISLYKKTLALIMPTYVARSTLTLYEAFFFKTPVLYSDGILDKDLEQFVTTFDLNDPNDLSQKLEDLISANNNFNEKINNAYLYFQQNLKNEVREKILLDIIKNYEYIQKRWKDS